MGITRLWISLREDVSPENWEALDKMGLSPSFYQ